jgi:hypothetical protein
MELEMNESDLHGWISLTNVGFFESGQFNESLQLDPIARPHVGNVIEIRWRRDQLAAPISTAVMYVHFTKSN